MWIDTMHWDFPTKIMDRMSLLRLTLTTTPMFQEKKPTMTLIR